MGRATKASGAEVSQPGDVGNLNCGIDGHVETVQLSFQIIHIYIYISRSIWKKSYQADQFISCSLFAFVGSLSPRDHVLVLNSGSVKKWCFIVVNSV